jgi:hypothetical protein
LYAGRTPAGATGSPSPRNGKSDALDSAIADFSQPHADQDKRGYRAFTGGGALWSLPARNGL